MALVPQDLKDDLGDIFNGVPSYPTTTAAAAQAWADAIDSYMSVATSQAHLVLTPGASALKTALETALGTGLPGLAATGIKNALLTYVGACTWPGGSGTTVMVDDVGGAGFDAAMATELAILSDDGTAKGNTIGGFIDDFVKDHRGNFAPPPDPNHHPIL